METKPWYKSKGVLGSAGAIIAGILGMWFADITADDVTDILIATGALVSGILALVGRLKADKPIA